MSTKAHPKSLIEQLRELLEASKERGYGWAWDDGLKTSDILRAAIAKLSPNRPKSRRVRCRHDGGRGRVCGRWKGHRGLHRQMGDASNGGWFEKGS
jgi:hypothetical protein